MGCTGPAVAAGGDTLKVVGLGRTNPITTKDNAFKQAVKLQQVSGHISMPHLPRLAEPAHHLHMPPAAALPCR